MSIPYAPHTSASIASDPAPALVTPAPWGTLRRFTDARIALGRAGHSLPTEAHLEFQLAHAQARDAVHLPFDAAGLISDLERAGLPTLRLHSAALDRNTYLQRPDLGRRLSAQSLQAVSHHMATAEPNATFDLAIVVADGLSALAVHHHALPLIAALRQRLQSENQAPWLLAPVALVEQARVAVGDEVGQALGARAVVVLIGERPGLSSPDSMGIYLSWSPRVGLTDAQRNCISNVRPAGLRVDEAADKLCFLLRRARTLGLTGVALKDDSDGSALGVASVAQRLLPQLGRNVWNG
ncbi:MAG: ethanolamine ammonia-lyase subunit EutC [Rhodoferax sp.]|nr:ethanolamine ammonia-lyase subunit EutC [Rhodoferax sp.]